MKVLYWGHRDWSPIPYYRGQQFRDYWPQYGIEASYLRHEDMERAASDWAPIDWADVVVFRRWYADEFTPLAWDRAASKARIYDTDDWDLGTNKRVPQYDVIAPKLGLVRKMAREADIVTTSTPRLADRYSVYSRRSPLVLRNAVDLSLYQSDEPEPAKATAVFYGSHASLAYYFGSMVRGKWVGGYAHAAVAEMRMPSIWIGEQGFGPTSPREFSQIIPYDYDLRGFARTLTGTRAAVGVAPLPAEEFEHCKSELHWLDYSAAGIPTVAERAAPYAVIHDGADGFLARGRDEWFRAVRRLAQEVSLRKDTVAAARERLSQEYDPATRAGEWAEVFRLAREG